MKGIVTYPSRDITVQLNLISKIHGLEEAKRYFIVIPITKKEYKVYCSFLICYVEYKSLDEANSIMQKNKECGHMNSTMPFNHMLRLYAQMGINAYVGMTKFRIQGLPSKFCLDKA